MQKKESLDKVIEYIIKLNDGIREFWSKSEGWAPDNAAELLNISRLDWQVSLSKCLHLWLKYIDENIDNDHGALILAWANLGSLVEGTLKLFLCVYYDTYSKDVDRIMSKEKLIEPNVMFFDRLRQFLYNKKKINDTWDTWISHIIYRRNSLHAFKDREIGNWEEYSDDIRKYCEFLEMINDQLPYPF